MTVPSSLVVICPISFHQLTSPGMHVVESLQSVNIRCGSKFDIKRFETGVGYV